MHQVLLVRNEEAKLRLPPELLQSKAIVMTCLQSKGLEFEDVLVVDFFADSPCQSEWRTLLTHAEVRVW